MIRIITFSFNKKIPKTTQMERYINRYKTNIPVILMVFYSLGYVYLNRYYDRFNISIENYVNLTDILFVTLKSLISLLLTYLVVEICLYLVSRSILKIIFPLIINREKIKRAKNKNLYDRYYYLVIESQIKGLSIFVLILGTFVLLYFIEEPFIIFSLFFPFLIIKLYQIYNFENNKERKEIGQVTLIMLYIILLFSFGIWGHLDGNSTKVSNSNSFIEFYENQDSYNTNLDSLNYIGETSSYLFIYDKINRTSLIFNKGNISNFKVKDITLTSEEKKEMIKQGNKEIDAFFNKLK